MIFIFDLKQMTYIDKPIPPPWAFDINDTKKKNVKKVDWMDAKGNTRHTEIQVYARGKNKGKPKQTCRGALHKDGSLKCKGEEAAAALHKRYRSFLYKRNKARAAGKEVFNKAVHADVKSQLGKKHVMISARRHVKKGTPNYYAGKAKAIAKGHHKAFNKEFNKEFEKEIDIFA